MTDADRLLEKTHAISGVLEEEAQQSDALGALTDRTLAALRSGDFFALMVPKCLGGAEASPVAAIKVVEALSRANGSAGWVVMAVGLATGTAAAFLENSAIEEIFTGETIPIIAGHGGANGTAVVEGNGFRLKGTGATAAVSSTRPLSIPAPLSWKMVRPGAGRMKIRRFASS